MYRKDYIQRQFEEFGKVLALLMTLKKNRDWEEFEKELQSVTQKISAFRLEELEKMDLPAFVSKILRAENQHQDQQKMMARILFEKLDYYAAVGDEKNFGELKEKCLALYQHLQDNFTSNEFDLDVHYKLAALKNL